MELRAWAYLKSRRKDELGGEPHEILGPRLSAWLTDRKRWTASGCPAAWGTRSLASAGFVIRAIEAWPDEDILVDLKAECEAGLEVPPKRDGRVDLLAWWLLRDRGMRPFGGKANHKVHPVYGVLVYTRFGNPIFMALRAAEFMTRDGDGPCPAYVDAMCQIFQKSWDLTDTHFYRDGWKIIRVARNFDRDRQPEAWGYIHPCLFSYVRNEMLKTPQRNTNVCTYHVQDEFRRMLEQACAEQDAADFVMDVAAQEASPIDELDEREQATDHWLTGVLKGFSPTCRAAFLIAYMPPGEWTEGAISDLAEECGVETRALRDFILEREDRVVLPLRRKEACEEKVEYLSALIEKTEHSLGTALAQRGLSPRDSESRIISLKKHAAAPGVQRNELSPLPKGVPPDSVEFLEPWLQEITWRRETMRRRGERFGEELDRECHKYSRDEKRTLSQLLGCTERQIDECITAVMQAIQKRWDEEHRLG